MRRATRLGLAVAGVLAVAAPLATATKTSASFDAPADKSRLMYATDDQGNLHRFWSRFPSFVRTRAITGLPQGVSLRGIDFRPATGDLYAVGSDEVIYRLNPSTAIAVAEGPAFDDATANRLNSANLGVDFNPTVDRLRITSDADDNLRAEVDSGQIVSTDKKLNPAGQKVAGSAYTNSSFSATRPTSTILYALSTLQDRVHVQAPPNDGTLDAGKPLGRDFGPDLGFDIAGKNNVGYVAGAAAAPWPGTRLWKLDVTTGATWPLGRIGDGTVTVTGLAAYQDLG